MVSSNDVHRLFLQAILSRRIVSYSLGHILWVKSIEAVKAADETLDIPIPKAEDRAPWEDFIAKINISLNGLDLEFRHLHDEISGREMYALVNRKGDEIAQMATDYTPVEIAYFKAIVEQIMLAPSETFSVSSLAALREVNHLKTNVTKTQAEVILGSFVAKGWLIKSQRGRYALSTRTLLELLPYLKSTYPDEFIECTICMEILTRGVACYTRNCKARLHNHCFNNYKRLHVNCPTCSQNWTNNVNKLISVGEGGVKDAHEDGKRRVRRRESAEGAEGSGEEDDEIDEASQTQASQSQSQKKKGKKGKANGRSKKSAANRDEEDEEEDEEEPPADEGMDVDEDEDAPRRSQAQGKRKGRR